MQGERRLQGVVLDVEKVGEERRDEVGDVWTKCIFTVELTGFSRRTLDEKLPEELKSKKIRLVRWCLYDWHYELGVKKTLEPEETEDVLSGKPSKTVYW